MNDYLEELQKLDLEKEYSEVILPLLEEYNNDSGNKQKKEKYEKAEKKYLKNACLFGSPLLPLFKLKL